MNLELKFSNIYNCSKKNTEFWDFFLNLYYIFLINYKNTLLFKYFFDLINYLFYHSFLMFGII